MRTVTLGDRLRYRFDNLMARGPVAMIGWLAVLTIAAILAVTTLVVATGVAPAKEGNGGRPGFLEVAWMAMMRTLDAGTMGGDSGPWLFLFAMFIITILGILVVSSLIGILTTGMERKLDELRKGRSFVVEQNHTVILGWSPQVFDILSELVIANQNQHRPCVAILADKDRVEMEDEIRAKVGSTRNTRVVCRSGDPIEISDLEIVNPHAARSIIVLAPTGDDPDSHTIKTLLAITNNPNRRPQPYHIVAAMRDPRKAEVARLAGKNEVQLVLAEDVISRIAVQACRQAGLSVVYSELLDFAGDEIYFQEEPRLVGCSFGQALLAYEDSSLIGLRRRSGKIEINPDPEIKIEAGDKVIAISADDDTVVLSGRQQYEIATAHMRKAPVAGPPQPERTLFLGWNHRARAMIYELDAHATPGSELTVVSGGPEAQREFMSFGFSSRNLTVTFKQGDTTARRLLDSLAIGNYQHLVTLSLSDELDPQTADARTLVTLLHLRDIGGKLGRRLSIVAEMMDVRNRELAAVARVDDFIVSDRLISLMLTQISENKELSAVFQDLFDPEGSEIYFKPAEDYVALGQAVNFYTVVEAARRRHHLAIGYGVRAAAESKAGNYGIVVNPAKSKPITFAEGDRIIVLAED